MQRTSLSLYTALCLTLTVIVFSTITVLHVTASSSNAIVPLDQSNFDQTVIKDRGLWLVAFTAPWCPHCTRLEPDLARAAKSLGGVVSIAQVNADQEKSLAYRFGVQGFPTLKIFGAGLKAKSSPEDYTGARSAKAMVDALMYRFRGIRDPVVSIKTVEQLKQFLNASDDGDLPRAVLFTGKPSNPDLFKSLAINFDNEKEMRFAFVGNADTKTDVMEAVGVSDAKSLIVIPAGATELSERVLYSDTLKKRDMLKFLQGFVKKGSGSASGNGNNKNNKNNKPSSANAPKKSVDDSVEKIDTQEKLQNACAKLCLLQVIGDEQPSKLIRSLATKYGKGNGGVIHFGTLSVDNAQAKILNSALAPTYEQEESDAAVDVVVIRQNRKRYLRKNITKENAQDLVDRLLDGFAGLTFKPMSNGIPTLVSRSENHNTKDEL